MSHEEKQDQVISSEFKQLTCQVEACSYNAGPLCRQEWMELDSNGTCIFIDLRPYQYVDSHSLATWIGNPARYDQKGAAKEWEGRHGKPYPYHPSYDDNVYIP